MFINLQNEIVKFKMSKKDSFLPFKNRGQNIFYINMANNTGDKNSKTLKFQFLQ